MPDLTLFQVVSTQNESRNVCLDKRRRGELMSSNREFRDEQRLTVKYYSYIRTVASKYQTRRLVWRTKSLLKTTTLLSMNFFRVHCLKKRSKTSDYS